MSSNLLIRTSLTNHSTQILLLGNGVDSEINWTKSTNLRNLSKEIPQTMNVWGSTIRNLNLPPNCESNSQIRNLIRNFFGQFAILNCEFAILNCEFANSQFNSQLFLRRDCEFNNKSLMCPQLASCKICWNLQLTFLILYRNLLIILLRNLWLIFPSS